MVPTSHTNDKGKHIGRVRALTTLSPVRRERERKLDGRLKLVRWIPNAGRPLQELAFIHYGRWTVLRDLPDPTGSGDRRPLNSRYLLFESNYDGGVSDYLDAFADTVPHRLARLWGTCVSFESDVMHARGAEGREVSPWAFREYVARNELEVLHFYAAYPWDTVIAVRQAIEFDARLGSRLTASDSVVRGLQAAAVGPVPDGAGPVGRARRIFRDWRASTRKRYGVDPFTVIAPITPSRLEELKARLRRLPSEQSPFGRVPATHYARFVLMPHDLTDLDQKRPDRLETSYLLFTSNHCGSADDYIASIRTEMPEAADAIWGCCAAYPGHGAAAFAGWFRRHSYDTDYFVAGYAPRSPATIRRYVARRRAVAEMGPQPLEALLRAGRARRGPEESTDGP